MVPKYPCLKCMKSVKSNQNAIMCVNCTKWIHLSCSSLDQTFFLSNLDWICDSCLLHELPFYNITFNDSENVSKDENSLTEDQSTCIINEDIFKTLRSVSGITIAHLNVCSLLKNIEEIRSILNETKLSIFTLSETRLDNTVPDGEVDIDCYRIVRRDRNRNGGGVITYIHESLNYFVLQELLVDGLESICIEVRLPKQKPFIVFSWYRPPDSSIKIFDLFEKSPSRYRSSAN